MGRPTVRALAASTSKDAIPVLSMYLRNAGLRFENPDGSCGETAYPINYEELYNLKGRLLTLIDATFTDPQQRKAHKDIVWQTLKGWMDDIESAHPALWEGTGAHGG